jgi:FtsP/CotA-like multicopper oxidase with cupredoxin domain
MMIPTGRFGTASTVRRGAVAVLVALGLATLISNAAPGVQAQQGASPVADCPTAADLTAPLTEIVSDGKGQVRGTIVLANGRQAFPMTNARCVQQLLRFFQKTEMPLAATPAPPLPTPGPTIRARLGDVIQLLFLNQINVLDYGQSIDVWESGRGDCDTSSTGYPQSAGDTWPNCYHGSTSGNIHFHGTHTNPNSTGDNVFLNTRPSPWSNGKPVVTEALARQNLGTFFDDCAKRLMADNLSKWPAVWGDLPPAYTKWQEQLLLADGQGKPAPQQLWRANNLAVKAGAFPLYYIGAFPTCFVVPKFPGVQPKGAKLRMGQAPGTHWYHAHKHGSTALNVSNGMAGAIIIEGDEYDGFFDKTYAAFRQNPKTTWTRQQPTLVVNQYNTTPSLLRGGGSGAPPLAVNGSLQPTLTMYPGQVQLWRIVNASVTTGFYVSQLPAGFTWQQTAQDGVQFDNNNYVARAQRPVFVGAANRIDLLVKAPAGTGTFPFNITANTSVSGAQNGQAPQVLFNINVAGSGTAMNLVSAMPARPAFLNDISPKEVDPNNARTLTFNTVEVTGKAAHHSINGVQFDEGGATVDIPVLNTVGEWTLVNKSNFQLDHPFHIHINPFQITELFDPAAPLLDAKGVPMKDKNGQNIPLYMVSTQQPTLQAGQCWLNPNDNTTWKPCPGKPLTTTNIWWDVFPIPSAIVYPVDPNQGPQVTIPGYFKMRTRFVDYGGSFVLHCHILDHEDRGMMFQVNIGPTVVNSHSLHR